MSRRSLVVVADERSRRLLGQAGIAEGVDVVPELALIAHRLFAEEHLDKRRRFLEAAGWMPAEGRSVLVQGHARLAFSAPAVATALLASMKGQPADELVLVAAGTAEGDDEFLKALAAGLPVATRRLPTDIGIDDLVAAVHAARAVLCSDRFLAGVAVGHGVPVTLLAPPGTTTADDVTAGSLHVAGPAAVSQALDGMLSGARRPPDCTSLIDDVDRHLDRLASFVLAASRQHHAKAAQQPGSGVADLQQRVQALQRAHQLRSRRLVEERAIFQAEFARLEAERRAERKRSEEVQAQLAGELAAAQAEVERYRTSKTWRYTEPLRALYSRLRGWRG